MAISIAVVCLVLGLCYLYLFTLPGFHEVFEHHTEQLKSSQYSIKTLKEDADTLSYQLVTLEAKSREQWSFLQTELARLKETHDAKSRAVAQAAVDELVRSRR